MSKENFEKQKYTYEDVVQAVQYGYNYGTSWSPEADEKIPDGNVQQWLEATKTRTADEWQHLFPDIMVIDPDGWREVGKSQKREWYEEQITYQEYVQRRDRSTCQFKNIKE